METIILFDLDGTLTDPKEGITRAVQYALRAYGIEEEDLDKLCPFIGPPLSDSFMEFYGFTQKDAREAIPVFHEYFVKQGMFENKVYSGMKEMLGALRDAGCTLAVATSKPEPFAIQILEHFGLLSYFKLVGGADMEEIRVKKGDVIRYTLERLGAAGAIPMAGKPVPMAGQPVPAAGQPVSAAGQPILAAGQPGQAASAKPRVLMVGDRRHDVIGAAENGIDCVGVLYGYGSREELSEAGARYLAGSVEELGQLLLSYSCFPDRADSECPHSPGSALPFSRGSDRCPR